MTTQWRLYEWSLHLTINLNLLPMKLSKFYLVLLVVSMAVVLYSCDSSLVDSGTSLSSADYPEMQQFGHVGVEVVINKNVGFVLTGLCGVAIPELRSTYQTKNGDIHFWTVLYQAPEDCDIIPEKGVVRLPISFAGNIGTLTINPSGLIISKFVSDRGF